MNRVTSAAAAMAKPSMPTALPTVFLVKRILKPLRRFQSKIGVRYYL